MPRSGSINQNTLTERLPNFRNLGVVLRVVVWVCGLLLGAAVLQADSLSDVLQRYLQAAALAVPVMLVSLLALYVLNPVLLKLSYWQGVALIAALAMMCTWGILALGGGLFQSVTSQGTFHLWRQLFLAAAVVGLLLAYFKVRNALLSPALPSAKRQALQARIRPHFLFNSINAVLGIVRQDPKRAEGALEDMADLFRMAMADYGEMVTLKREVELTRQYLALEQLRLGERLRVSWQLDEMPSDAMVPPLMLQPLLENAVYHGIEPLHEGGEITINIYRKGNEMHLDVYNPYQPNSQRHQGNKIALANIRERLALQFDLEASYNVDAGKDYYRVHILIPYVKEESQ